MNAQLRIFWPDDLPAKGNQSGHSRQKTLCEFYEDYVLPSVRLPRSQSSRTIEQDLVALGHWKRITGDPPLDQITTELCGVFMAQLADEGMSPSTRRKTAVHLQFILDHAGPIPTVSARVVRAGGRLGGSPDRTPSVSPVAVGGFYSFDSECALMCREVPDDARERTGTD